MRHFIGGSMLSWGLVVVLASACLGQSPPVVTLLDSPRAVDQSFSDNWPNSKGLGVHANYHRPATDGGVGSRIAFRFHRSYAVGPQQKPARMAYAGTLLDPQVGEVFVLVNALVKLREPARGHSPSADLELLPVDNELSEHTKLGVLVSEGSGIGDGERAFWLRRIHADDEHSKALLATLEFTRKGAGTEKLRVGDTIHMEHFKLKLTHIEAADKKVPRRGWIALKPVLPDPVNVLP